MINLIEELDLKGIDDTLYEKFYTEKSVVYYVQRLKRMLIVSGYNVYPSHIENLLLEHPAILNYSNTIWNEEIVLNYFKDFGAGDVCNNNYNGKDAFINGRLAMLN